MNSPTSFWSLMQDPVLPTDGAMHRWPKIPNIFIPRCLLFCSLHCYHSVPDRKGFKGSILRLSLKCFFFKAIIIFLKHFLSAKAMSANPKKGGQSERLAKAKECHRHPFISRLGILLLPVYRWSVQIVQFLHDLLGPLTFKSKKEGTGQVNWFHWSITTFCRYEPTSGCIWHT